MNHTEQYSVSLSGSSDLGIAWVKRPPTRAVRKKKLDSPLPEPFRVPLTSNALVNCHSEWDVGSRLMVERLFPINARCVMR